jgi:hypothetical protein
MAFQAQHFLHQLRLESADADVGDVANGTVAQSLEPLEWRMVRRFPPLVSPGDLVMIFSIAMERSTIFNR